MKNSENLITNGYLKNANDFFKYLVIDFKKYTKSALNFFQKTNPVLVEKVNEPRIIEIQTTPQGALNSHSIPKHLNFKNMSNLRNNVQLIGRLGKNPEVKQLESGRYVANVSIATNDIYKNSKGEKVIETQWHNLVAWGKNAENFQKILAKGDEVAIQGKLTHRSYEDKEGITRYVSEIVVNEFVKLSSRMQMAQVA